MTKWVETAVVRPFEDCGKRGRGSTEGEPRWWRAERGAYGRSGASLSLRPEIRDARPLQQQPIAIGPFNCPAT